jgi:hypothetical protein
MISALYDSAKSLATSHSRPISLNSKFQKYAMKRVYRAYQCFSDEKILHLCEGALQGFREKMEKASFVCTLRFLLCALNALYKPSEQILSYLLSEKHRQAIFSSLVSCLSDFRRGLCRCRS